MITLKLKKKLAKALGMAAMLSVLIQGPYALADELTMTTDGNVRKEASTSADKLGTASNGDTFTIEGQTTGSDGRVWYQISLNGSTGYVREDLVSVSVSSAPETTSTVLESSISSVAPYEDGTPIRSSASGDGSVITEAAGGSELTVTGETMDDSGNMWYQVDAGGQSGFVRSDMVEIRGQAGEAGDIPDGGGYGDTTTISSVVSSRILPEGSDLEQMSIDRETLQSWESGNYYVLYTKKTNDDSDPGEWYLYSIDDKLFQRIATLDASDSDSGSSSKKPLFGGNNRLILVIGGVLIVALALCCILLAMRLREYRNYGGMDFDDDDDDEDDDDDDDEDEDDDDDRYRVPSKRGARNSSRRDPAPRNFLSRGRGQDIYEDDDDEDDDDDEEEYTRVRRGTSRMKAPRQQQQQQRRRPDPRSRGRRYEEYEDDDEDMDDDDFEFEFLNDK